MSDTAGEIERLKSLTRFQDRVIRSGNVACLTQSEREAIWFAIAYASNSQHPCEATLRGLLERLGGEAR